MTEFTRREILGVAVATCVVGPGETATAVPTTIPDIADSLKMMRFIGCFYEHDGMIELYRDSKGQFVIHRTELVIEAQPMILEEYKED